MVIPTSAMKRIKEEARGQGRQEALDELAKAAGYESNADLVQALAKLKAPAPAGTPAPAPAAAAPVPAPGEPAMTPEELARSKDSRREQSRYERQIEKVLGERNRYAQSATEWQRKARDAQAETDAVRAEMHLRTIAAGVGLQDIDYAITLFSREVEKLTPEQAEKFDERAYFDGLRKTKPLLFGEAVLPAGTGPGGGAAPPPAPGTVTQRTVTNGKVDARKMSPQEYRAHLAKMGITPGI